jgi:hypothetical protein
MEKITMLKLILMILLTGVSASSHASWVQVGSNASFNSYADPSTIRKDGIKSMEGSKAKMLSLIDLTTVMTKAGKSYASIKAQHEFDCRQEQVRMLYSSVYSGHMGSGVEVEGKFQPEFWRPIPTRSLEEVLWKVACGKI